MICRERGELCGNERNVKCSEKEAAVPKHRIVAGNVGFLPGK